MRQASLALLRCPACRGALEVARIHAATAAGDVREGVLACSACAERYPVLAWIARLVPPASFVEAERSVLERAPGAAPETVPAEAPNEAEAQRSLDEKSRAKIFPADMAAGLEAQAKRDFEYRSRHTFEKMKFVRTVAPFLSSSPRVILDVGGGQGGTLTAFRETFAPEHAFLLDLDPEWVEVARLRDPATEVVRGDATRLPFGEQSVDLLITTATLEHIPEWREALREFARVADQGLVCYGPNGSFPYDLGHVDAPFVTWLPKPAAAWVGAAYHGLRRTGRTIETVRRQLGYTFYVPRVQAARELQHTGATVTNVFREFLEETVSDDYHVFGGRLLQELRRHPRWRHGFGRVLTALGMEPNVYLFFRARASAPDSPPPRS